MATIGYLQVANSILVAGPFRQLAHAYFAQIITGSLRLQLRFLLQSSGKTPQSLRTQGRFFTVAFAMSSSRGNSPQEREEEEEEEPRITVNALSFEILDTVFSYFSTPGALSPSAASLQAGLPAGDANAYSYYEAQQDLLSFCMVNKQFYQAARSALNLSRCSSSPLICGETLLCRSHLARSLAFASTTRAQQIIKICENDESFGLQVQALSLRWPNQGKYATRHLTVLQLQDVIASLENFTALRSLELICLPFPRLEPAGDQLLHGRLASRGALANLRTLKLRVSPWTLRNEQFHSVAVILSMCPLLKVLELENMPLEADPVELLEMGNLGFSLNTLSVKLTSPRALSPEMLSWMLQHTIEAQTLQDLTLQIGTTITERMEYVNTVKESQGFSGIGEVLAKAAPSLVRASLLGLRAGQLSAILSKTTSRLEALDLYGTFGIPAEILSDLPFPSSRLHTLRLLPLIPGYGPLEQISLDEEGYHPEVPISSASFMEQARVGGSLESLNKITVPENARFMKRGKWYNNALAKVCRRRAIAVIELKRELAA